MYVVVTKWTGGNRFDKGFDTLVTEQDAIDKLNKVIGIYPDAFYDIKPQGGPRDWLIDPVLKTLSYSVDHPARCAEIKPGKMKIAREEFKRRGSLAHGIDPRDQFKKMARTLKLLQKKVKGTASGGEMDQLDADEANQDTVEVLEDKLDILLDLINDETDSGVLAGIDPVNDSHWT